MPGSFTQGGEGAFGLGQEKGMILIGRKDGEMEWQEVCPWSTGKSWRDGVVGVVTAPLGRGVCIGKEWGLGPDRSRLYPVLAGWMTCLHILIFPCVFGSVLTSSLGGPGVFRPWKS